MRLSEGIVLEGLSEVMVVREGVNHFASQAMEGGRGADPYAARLLGGLADKLTRYADKLELAVVKVPQVNCAAEFLGDDATVVFQTVSAMAESYPDLSVQSFAMAMLEGLPAANE